MFIHIGPEETSTIRRVPRKLLFPALVRPEGHLVMGYNHKGECPMPVDAECSIYEDRPQTCRAYDCRVFTATGVEVDATQPEISARVQAWSFEYGSEAGREKHLMLQKAAAYLQENRELFEAGSIPEFPAALAAYVIRANRARS